MTDDAVSRQLLPAAALAYTAFVVYGSLVPLDFHALPWDEAWNRFRHMPYLALGVGARADWVANMLLFMPLAFLWLGSSWHPWHPGWRLLASAFVVLAATLFSAAIEFTQVFFPPRTVSLNDLVAEGLGASMGVAAWWAAGPRLMRWFEGWRQARGPLQKSERLLLIWLTGLFGYNLLPLDLTLSPVELYHKWKAGRVVLIPFSALPSDGAAALYELLTDVALWVPAAGLWRRTGLSFARALGYTVLAAGGLECLQLWVYSRVTDVTDVFTAALGGALGAWVAGPRRHSSTAAPSRAAWGWLAAAWAGVLALTFWYPFDFQSDPAFLARQAQALLRPPLTAYYFGTEFRAVTEVLHKLLFFLPLGWALAQSLGHRGLSLALGALMAAGVEAGQLFLPGKHADLADWLLETAGAVGGVMLAGFFGGPRPSPRVEARYRPGVGWAGPALAWAAMAAALWLAAKLPFVPYNVRELLGGERPLLSALGLSLALMWLIGFPAAFAARVARLRRPNLAYWLAVPIHGVVAYALLRLAVPVESLHDVVGSPSLDWLPELELFARFLGLALGASAALFGGAMLALSVPRPLAWSWVASVPVLLGLAYAVVVGAANTDNLTELLAHDARLDAFVWTWLAAWLLALGGYGGAAWLAGRGPSWAPWLVLASGPLAFGCLQLGLESTVVKYGRVFSALQFLLSSDRDHYAAPAELALRFTLAWALGLALVGGIASVVARPLGKPGPRGQHQGCQPRPEHGHPGSQARDVEVARRC